MISLRLLGGAWLETSSGPLTGRATQRQRVALLASLAIAHPRPLSRDRLIADLWPESDTPQARHLLRDSLYVLRSGLGEAALLSVGDDLRLNSERVTCDVWEFEAALTASRLEDAVRAYGGPFLDGFHLSDAEEFERWTTAHRQRLAHDYARALETLGAQARQNGDAAMAVGWWRRLAELDRFNGRVAVELMRVLDDAGDRAGAIRHADVHSALLREELGAEPDPDVQKLAERLRLNPVVRIATSEQRPASDAAAASPEPVPVAAPAQTTPRPGPPRSRRWGAFAPVLLGLAVLLGASLLAPGSSELSSERIAVDVFENRTGDPTFDPLGSMASDWIAQGLSQTGLAEVVPATMVARWLPRESGNEKDRLRTLARETGSGIVVTGAFYRTGDSLHFQAQIADGSRGQLLKAVGPLAGVAAAPLVGLDQLRARVLAGVLGIREPRLALSAGSFGQPPVYEAYREYLDGLQLQWNRDFTRADEHFLRAAQLDTTWIIPVLGLAMVAANRGALARADSLARIVDRSRKHLAPFEQANLDLVFSWVRRDRVAAYEAAVRAARLVPGSAQEIQVGIEALKLNRPREAVRVLSAMDPDRSVVHHNSYYWDYLAQAYHLTGQHRRELVAARNGRRAHPDNSYPVLAELRALVALGRIAEVERISAEILAAPPLRALVTGWVLMWTSCELRAHGHIAAGNRLAAQSLRWWEQVPEAERAASDHRRHYAATLHLAGRYDEARHQFALLLEQSPADVEGHVGLGVIAAKRGDRAEAEQMERWLATNARTGRLDSPTMYRAFIAAQLGDRDRAVELIGRAFAEGRAFDIYLHTDPDLEPLRGYPPFEAIMRAKD